LGQKVAKIGKNWPQNEPLPQRLDKLFEMVGQSFACSHKAAASFQGVKSTMHQNVVL
jgi:hypothetical protein